MPKRVKEVALISGGLDSLLAAKIIQDQGVHVEGINFYTGFCVEGHTHAIRKHDQTKPKRNNALWSAEQLGIKLHIIDIIEEYKSIVLNPKYGYGANLNPCLDCKIFMVSQAKKWLEENDFDFIITGEVIGQRPMSQRKDTMPVIAKRSEADDLLLRPLSAKNLPETLPESKGWVDRDKLYGISCRGRKQQMALAEKFGFIDYAQPAGGCCFVTNKEYAVKLQDLWQARRKKDYELDDIMLLKVGRYLRPKPYFKLIIAREEGENNFLTGYKNQFMHMFCSSGPGTLMLIDGNLKANDLELAASILGRFTKGRHADKITIEFTGLSGEEKTIVIQPMPEQEVKKDWYL